MNAKQEIETAMSDFHAGKFGRMPALEANADLAGMRRGGAAGAG
jgi:hypothetical protein